MNLDWFKDLQALEQTRSFSKASYARNISQPALTRRIKALEIWAEQSLVNRNERPVSLTDAGSVLLSTCAEFFDTLESQRLDLLNRKASNKQAIIRFAAQHSIAWHFFPDWLREIEMQFGPISTRMRAEDLAECMHSFIEQEVNFLLAYDVVNSEIPKTTAREIERLSVGKDSLVPICAPNADGKPIFECDSARTLPLISYGKSTPLGKLFETHLRPKLVSQNIQLIYENSMSSTLLNWALKGVGVCWLPSRLVKTEITNGHLVLAGDERFCVDLNISLFSQRNARFGLINDIWNYLSKETKNRTEITKPKPIPA